MGPHPIAFIAIVIMPYVLIAAAFCWLIRLAWQSKSPSRLLFLYPLVLALVLTALFVAWGLHDISTSRSSTAAIGYIFLPFYSVGFAAVSFLVSGAAFYIVRFGVERVGRGTSRLTSWVPAVGAVVLLALAAGTVWHHVARKRSLASAKSEPVRESVIEQAIASHDGEVLAALAGNSRTSVGDLQRIYQACGEPTGTANSRDYKVLYALSNNPKTPPEILAALADRPEESIRVRLGINPSTPAEILPRLAEDPKPMVRTWVTVNPHISKELLQKLANDSEKTVRSYAESALRHRGLIDSPANPADSPQDAALQEMAVLGRRAASGDLQAVDEIEERRSKIYEGVDLKNDRAKAVANLKLMRAAFDILGNEAAHGGEAMKALEYADGKPRLRSFTVDAFGLAAGGGNPQALEALLNYKARGWLLSSTVSAMKYPAANNQPQAVDFLIAVLDNPQDRPLHHMARQGLEKAAENGGEKARAALETHPKQ